MTTASDLTKQGIAAHRGGDRATAARLFVEAVQADPKHEMAWLWLSSSLDAPAEKRYCLDRALAANPESQPARTGLAQLADVAPQVPAALAGEAIEAPPELAGAAPMPAQPAQSDLELLEREMAAYTSQGWRIASQGATSFQAVKPREWSKAGVVLFVALPAIGAFVIWFPLFFVAIAGLVLVAADYMLKKEETKFVTVTAIRQELERMTGPHIRLNAAGRAFCSNCQEYVRVDAKTCKHCGVVFERQAAAA